MTLTLALFSDLHTEFYSDSENEWFFKDLEAEGADVAVLAGDILLGRNSHRFIQRMASSFPQVVHVAGNHEYYSGEFESIQRGLRETASKIDNYHFLEKDVVEIQGQRFVGCTMWYNGGPSCAANEMFMNDFRLIRHMGTNHSRFIYKYGSESKAWLKQNVRPDDVVVTHMLPHIKCIDPSWLGDPMNDFYYSDCDAILQENKPKLWLHGHSHNHFDQKIYETRVVRNPHGYPGERNVGFQKKLRICA